MLIAISGKQGVGKSSFLKKIEELGYGTVVEEQTARTVLTEWDTTLSEVYSVPKFHIKFQDELVKRKQMVEEEYLESEDIYFIERSYYDTFVYALMNLGKFNEHSGWLNDYYEQCMTLNLRYGGVVVLERNIKKVEDDNVRGTNSHYNELIGDALRGVISRDNFGTDYEIIHLDRGYPLSRFKFLLNRC